MLANDPPRVHVVFCVDNSGSMRRLDATSKTGEPISRAHAVAQCCRSLVEEQQQLMQATPHRQLFSQIMFNDQAVRSFTDLQIESVPDELERMTQPRLGTNYSSAWSCVEALIAERDWRHLEQFHVTFLSDGRPGELGQSLPALMFEKPTVLVNRTKMCSAPAIVQRLARKLGGRLVLHAVGIGDEDPAWLERLVDIANAAGAIASFMNPRQLKLCPTEPDVLGTPRAVDVAQIVPPIHGLLHHAHTLMQPPAMSARDFSTAGRHAVMGPPAAIASTSTLGDVFKSISSSLSATMSATASSQRVERATEYEAVDAWRSDDPTDPRTAHQTIYAASRLNVGAHESDVIWELLPREVVLRGRPFAHGGQRNAYHMFADGEHFVAKESRFVEGWNARLATHKLAMRIAAEAQLLASAFNEHKACSLRTASIPPISILPAVVYRLSAPGKSGNYRYLSVEPFLEGHYTKFNGNNGFVGSVGSSTHKGDTALQYAVAQTFTHWTYEHTLKRTGSALMVCDLQGVKFRYTGLVWHDRMQGS